MQAQIWTHLRGWANDPVMAQTSDDSPPQKPAPKKAGREDRLKAALKANMQRRKAQARARQAADSGDKKNDG